jgi:hypothetical protein
MNNLHKRYILFLLGCIPSRSYFAYYTKNASKDTLQKLSIIGIILAASWMYLYLTGSRTTGPEVFGDKIWWNQLRPVHSLIYLVFAYLAFTKNDKAYIPLIIDVIVGLSSFVLYHSK